MIVPKKRSTSIAISDEYLTSDKSEYSPNRNKETIMGVDIVISVDEEQKV